MALVFPEVTPGDPLRISASTFQTWKRCPGSAEARLQGIHSKDTRPSFAGTLAHLVFNRHLTTGPIGDDEFVMVCRQEIGTNLNHRMAEVDLRRVSDLEPLFEEVRDLYRKFVRLPTEGFREGEVDLEHEVPAAAVTLRGKIDAVFVEGDGRLRLVDWKTGGIHDPESQLGFYALLWALERGGLPHSVEAFSVKSGEVYRDEPTMEKVETVLSEVAEMVSSLRRAWRAEEGAVRFAGPWCEWCPILEGCPEGQAVMRLLD